MNFKDNRIPYNDDSYHHFTMLQVMSYDRAIELGLALIDLPAEQRTQAYEIVSSTDVGSCWTEDIFSEL